MVANYFYDLPNELQEKISETAEELELQEFITYERREAEKRSRRTYEWFTGLWENPSSPPSYENWKRS